MHHGDGRDVRGEGRQQQRTQTSGSNAPKPPTPPPKRSQPPGMHTCHLFLCCWSVMYHALFQGLSLQVAGAGLQMSVCSTLNDFIHFFFLVLRGRTAKAAAPPVIPGLLQALKPPIYVYVYAYICLSVLEPTKGLLLDGDAPTAAYLKWSLPVEASLSPSRQRQHRTHMQAPQQLLNCSHKPRMSLLGLSFLLGCFLLI